MVGRWHITSGAGDPAGHARAPVTSGAPSTGDHTVINIQQSPHHDFRVSGSASRELAVGRTDCRRKPGWAAGASMSPALLGDVLVLGQLTQVRAAYTPIGLTPDGGMSWTLPRAVGTRTARDLVLTGCAVRR